MLGPKDLKMERQCFLCAFELLTGNTMTTVHKCGGTCGRRESGRLQGEASGAPT